MKHAFISYVRENESDVNRLHECLEASGVPCWLDKKEIMPGEFWQTAIVEAIKDGAYFLACFSKESETKERSHMREEIYIAIQAGKLLPPNQKWIIPIRLSECSIPEYDLGGGRALKQVQYIDLFTDWDEGVRKIIKSLNAINTSIPNSSEIQKNWEEELKDTKIALFGGILHDLNNLNTAVSAYLGLIRMQAITDPDVAKYFDFIEKSVQRSSEMLKMALELRKK